MNWKQLRSEVDAHIEEKALDLIDAGVPQKEAWERARKQFGNATLVTEESREVWVWTWLERLWQDLVYAKRMLFKHPGFTAIAVMSLALGVGANCAIFSMADALLLRPLPVPHPGEIVNAGSIQPRGTAQGLNMSYADYRDFRSRSRSYSELGAFTVVRARLALDSGAAVNLRTAAAVSDNFFPAMEVRPVLGRVFEGREGEVPGRDPVMVLSNAFWQSQYAADPGVLGRTSRVDGIDFTIVGVMAEEFTGADAWVQPDFYIPAMMMPRLSGSVAGVLENRARRIFDVKGRLAEGVTLEQAQAEGAVLGKALASEYPDTNRNFVIEARTELQQRLKEGTITGPVLTMLVLLAFGVLLVACANVAGLLTSRIPTRAREMSLRLAIGAGRTRLVRQLLTESVILAFLGAVGGVVVGYAGVAFLRQLKIVSDMPVALSFRLDERALLVSLVVGIGSVFLFGVLPALRTARADLTETLRAPGSSSSAAHRQRFWTRNVLVTGQIALSIVLLTVAAIMYVTLQRDIHVGPGFQPDHVLLADVDPSLVDYSDAQMRDFYKNLPERVLAIPGVRAVGLGSGVPGGYDLGAWTVVPEHYQFPEGQEGVGMITTQADENYFDALGIGIQLGRGFTADDDADAPLVAIVNEQAASQFWPGQDPIGKRLRLASDNRWMEIVGVARNTRFNFLVERPQPGLYLPFDQHKITRATLVLKAEGDPASLAAPLREVVRSMDSSLPVFGVRDMVDAWDNNAVAPTRLTMQLIAAMGCMGVLLSLSGLYGVMAYSVSSRQREIGIRMAIGAQKGTVLGMILRQGLVLASVGTLLGSLLGLGTGRLMVAAFPTHTASPMVYIMVVPAVFLVTMLAAFLPARRATLVDPVRALRQD